MLNVSLLESGNYKSANNWLEWCEVTNSKSLFCNSDLSCCEIFKLVSSFLQYSMRKKIKSLESVTSREDVTKRVLQKTEGKMQDPRLLKQKQESRRILELMIECCLCLWDLAPLHPLHSRPNQGITTSNNTILSQSIHNPLPWTPSTNKGKTPDAH